MIYNHKEIDAKWQKIITKSIIFSFLILIFGGGKIFAQKTDLEKYDLKGKVKSVKVKTKYTYGKPCVDMMMTAKEGDRMCVSEFDDKGSLVKNSWYDYSKLSQEHIYFVEEGKKKVRINFYRYETIEETKIIDDTDDPEDKDRVTYGFDDYKRYLWEYDNRREYDSHGNWTLKEHINPGYERPTPDGGKEVSCLSQHQVFREIEYYN